MKDFIKKYKHAWVLSYFFIYMTWFLYLEKHITTEYTAIHTFIDDLIPFNEFFIIPYYLWFAYIVVTVAYFFFTSKEDYYKYTAFLFIGMTICLIIYTIWPNGQNLRPTEFERDNIFVDLVKSLYSTDTSTNVCPSIHAYNSIGAYIAISNSEKLSKYKWVKYISFILSLFICLSTMFLKQHSALDVICAIVLSIVMYLLVYSVNYGKIFAKKKDKEFANLR